MIWKPEDILLLFSGFQHSLFAFGRLDGGKTKDKKKKKKKKNWGEIAEIDVRCDEIIVMELRDERRKEKKQLYWIPQNIY